MSNSKISWIESFDKLSPKERTKVYSWFSKTQGNPLNECPRIVGSYLTQSGCSRNFLGLKYGGNLVGFVLYGLAPYPASFPSKAGVSCNIRCLCGQDVRGFARAANKSTNIALIEKIYQKEAPTELVINHNFALGKRAIGDLARLVMTGFLKSDLSRTRIRADKFLFVEETCAKPFVVRGKTRLPRFKRDTLLALRLPSFGRSRVKRV